MFHVQDMFYISYKVHLCFVSRIIIFCVQGLFIHCVHGLFHVLFTGFVCVVRSHGIQASGSIPRANISTRTTGELVFLCSLTWGDELVRPPSQSIGCL